MGQNVKFIAVRFQTTYDALETKDSFALYWVQDSQRVYKGDQLYGVGLEVTDKFAGLMSVQDKEKLEMLKSLVGNLPEDTKSTTIIEYIDEKIAGVASSEVIEHITDRVDVVEKDYLKSTDKNELQEQITENKTAIKNFNDTLDETFDNKINEFATKVTNDGVVNSYKELIDYVAIHGPEFTELVGEVNKNTEAINSAVKSVNNTLPDQSGNVEIKIAQPDWNQNDTTEADYIKNRPFYTKDPEEVEIFNSGITLEIEERDEEDPLSIDRGYFDGLYNYQKCLKPGDEVIIILDGVEYRVVTQYDEENWGYYIGNVLIEDPWYEDEVITSDEPFYISYQEDGQDFYIAIKTNEPEHTLIIKVVETGYEKIPEQYLPPIVQPDWSENDPKSSAYIKNRPFYAGDPTVIEVFNSDIELEPEDEDEEPTGVLRVNIEHEYYNLTPNMELTAIIDGVEYSGFSKELDGAYYIGNIGLIMSDSDEATNDPFILAYQEGQPMFMFYLATTETSHNLVVKATEVSYNKVPEQFLPPLVGRKLANNAEIFNDYTDNEAIGEYSHAEGLENIVSGKGAHVEGRENNAEGNYSHVEGRENTTLEYGDHAEGQHNTASGGSSHVEGEWSTASGYSSHAEGGSTTASGQNSHSEGYSTTASGNQSHAEGSSTTASGDASHTEGSDTTASGSSSHAEGTGTSATSANQHVQGKYNIVDSANKYAHILGNGTSSSTYGRSNAHTVDWNGNAWFKGKVYIGGTSQDDAQELGVITVDSTLSATSMNPVQNKVIKNALDNLKINTASNTEAGIVKIDGVTILIDDQGVISVNTGENGLAPKEYVDDLIASLQGDIDEISTSMDETLNLIGGEE